MIAVTAALIRRGNTILIARRPDQDDLAGLWEFPGGKIEDGESPEICLSREIQEELAITIAVSRFFADTVYEYPNKTVHLMAYWAEWLYGELKPQVHQELVWSTIADLQQYTFAPADRPFVKKLLGKLED